MNKYAIQSETPEDFGILGQLYSELTNVFYIETPSKLLIKRGIENAIEITPIGLYE